MHKKYSEVNEKNENNHFDKSNKYMNVNYNDENLVNH